MEEMLCPICGTPHPADAEACSYCGAPFTHPAGTREELPTDLSQQDLLHASDAGDSETPSMQIFEPDVEGDLLAPPVEDSGGPPLMWLPEDEWFGRPSETDEELSSDGVLPSETDSLGQSEADEGMPAWLRQALENEDQSRRQNSAVSSGDEDALSEVEALQTSPPLQAEEDIADALLAEEAPDFASILDEVEENDHPAWLDDMIVDDEQVARMAAQDEPDRGDFAQDARQTNRQAEAEADVKAPPSSAVPGWLDNLSDHPAFDFTRTRSVQTEADHSPSSMPEEQLSSAEAEEEGRVFSEEEEALPQDAPPESPPPVTLFAAQDLENEAVEETGPLAGLRGVLSGDEEFSPYSTPSVYSMKLRASERQKKEVMMLKQMLAKENRPQVPAVAERPASLRLGRMVTGIVLIVVILLPLLLGMQQAPVPGLYPVEAVNLHHAIDSLPEDSVVLVAMDYQPAFAGEMQPSALLVLSHLMERKARIALVSSVPEGPVMGHQLLLEAQTAYPTYNLNSRSVNLGYLPGDESGIRAFALAPQKTTRFGFDIVHNGAYAWQHMALKRSDSVDDFALVVLLTDSLEGGRAYIEQLQPALNGRPLLVVASAQAAPLLLPYYASDQIQGLLSGLSGAVTYQQLSGLPGQAGAYWSSYQYGIFTLIMLVLLGIPLQLFIMPNLKSNRKRKA